MAGTEMVLALNHWDRAIETHSANFPHAEHDCEDVSSITTAQIRRYPDSDVLLASPECTNHSVAKGARRRKPQAASLFDDGPAGDKEQDRSRATMWDVVRFAEQKVTKGRPYKAIVVENVVDAYKWGMGDDGGLFRAWLSAVRALGYEHEVVWLNSMFCPPVPQSRDRMYVVFWRPECVKRAPDLRVEPPSWCPSCERVVAGRQTFKKPHYRWGRYGAQYFYSCPDCYGTVFPGAFPAASVIDWSLPAPVIGERERPLAKNTRERIRRGLERLASEPFALRLLHGVNPRPLTLPLTTQTGRHDAAMVIPVAGNTHESTPGNRAKDPAVEPMATVHGTLDRALVTRTAHRSANGAYARGAATDPAFTATQAQDLALVYSNRANNAPRPAHEHPSHPVLTGGTLGIVEVQRNGGVRGAENPAHTVRAGGQHRGVMVSNYSPGWARRAKEGPLGSVTTQDGHSLVVPYSTQGKPKIGWREPVDTLTREEKMSLVVPYYGTGRASPAGLEPGPTVSTRDRMALVVTDEDVNACRFRMFSLPEIAAAMAMHLHPRGGEYRVFGNKRERMAQYGNGCTPPAIRLLVERILEVMSA
jgi:DNA (cytosine-5)-methyltransferase 1